MVLPDPTSSQHGEAEDNVSKQPRCKILLLSPYDAYSHQQWRLTLLEMFPDFDWTLLTLPPRYFAWRVRGNSLSWALEKKTVLERHYDLLICSSLTDLSGLRGLVPSLANMPTLVYFHENQFAYPTNGMAAKPNDKSKASACARAQNTAPESVEAALLSIYTALCADRILFNSQWNYESFVSGCHTLLNKLPDHVPAGIMPLITAKSHIQAVPLSDALFDSVGHQPQMPTPAPSVKRPLNIVWNHRHEYDKGPDLLLSIVQQLVAAGFPFRLHLLGQRFRKRPKAFTELESLLAAYYQHHRIPPGINQWLENRDEYLAQLRSADVVLSTALHDFQGLAIQEACIMGCLPVVPDALAYPEFIPQVYRYDAVGSLTEQAVSAVGRLHFLLQVMQQPNQDLPVPDFSDIQASRCRDQWLTHFNKLL